MESKICANCFEKFQLLFEVESQTFCDKCLRNKIRMGNMAKNSVTNKFSEDRYSNKTAGDRSESASLRSKRRGYGQ